MLLIKMNLELKTNKVYFFMKKIHKFEMLKTTPSASIAIIFSDA